MDSEPKDRWSDGPAAEKNALANPPKTRWSDGPAAEKNALANPPKTRWSDGPAAEKNALANPPKTRWRAKIRDLEAERDQARFAYANQCFEMEQLKKRIKHLEAELEKVRNG